MWLDLMTTILLAGGFNNTFMVSDDLVDWCVRQLRVVITSRRGFGSCGGPIFLVRPYLYLLHATHTHTHTFVQAQFILP